MERLRPLLVGAAILALLAGCDAIFTTNLFSWAQRDPANMSLDQRINYAEEALASGDPAAISDAYDAIKGDAAASTDGDLQLLAAQLALELSGLPDIMTDLLDPNGIDFAAGMTPANEAALEAVIAGLDAAYLAEAAAFYTQADGNQGSLDATDYLMGALAVLANVTIASGGDITPLVPGDVVVATDLLAGYLATADPADESYDIVNQLQTTLLGL